MMMYGLGLVSWQISKQLFLNLNLRFLNSSLRILIKWAWICWVNLLLLIQLKEFLQRLLYYILISMKLGRTLSNDLIINLFLILFFIHHYPYYIIIKYYKHYLILFFNSLLSLIYNYPLLNIYIINIISYCFFCQFKFIKLNE
jgi:hypothetical protein